MTTQQQALRAVIEQLGAAAFRVALAADAAKDIPQTDGHEDQLIGQLHARQREVEQIHGLYIAALAIHRSMPKGEK